MLAKPKPKPEDEPSSTIAAAASVEFPATDDREAEIERRLALLTPAMDKDMDTNKDMDTQNEEVKPPEADSMDVNIEEDLLVLAPVVVITPPLPVAAPPSASAVADPVPVHVAVKEVKEAKSNPKSALLVSLCSQSVSQTVRHI